MEVQNSCQSAPFPPLSCWLYVNQHTTTLSHQNRIKYLLCAVPMWAISYRKAEQLGEGNLALGKVEPTSGIKQVLGRRCESTSPTSRTALGQWCWPGSPLFLLFFFFFKRECV